MCYKCADCPMGNEKPTNACYTEVTTPANATTGCPAYTTYTTKPCECPSGYVESCPSGQYTKNPQKLADGTMCYQCTTCPTSFVRSPGDLTKGSSDRSFCAVADDSYQGQVLPYGGPKQYQVIGGAFKNPYECRYNVKFNGTVTIGSDGRKQRCAAYIAWNGSTQTKVLICGDTKTYNNEIVGVMEPKSKGGSACFKLYHNSGVYSAKGFKATFERVD